jgi:serine/threonine protein phosphatase PrpC
MRKSLQINAASYTSAGIKDINQDFHGIVIPKDPALSAKGVAAAIADGISSSKVSQIASSVSVKSFLSDYYCTSDSWTVKTSAHRVIQAINSWLFSQTRYSPYRYNRDKGYVCTFSAMVIKSATAHIFHSGDTRIYRIRDAQLEQLTEDHRYYESEEQNYLTRALGMRDRLEADYISVPVEEKDMYIQTSDGIHEHIPSAQLVQLLTSDALDLDTAAKQIHDIALENDSTDNLTIQILQVQQLPDKNLPEIQQKAATLPIPPPLHVRMEFDGYKVTRELYISSRSHVFLAIDIASNEKAVIKTPSIESVGDEKYLEKFLMEEWIARRLDNPHVLKASPPQRKQNYLYLATEYVDGQTLTQWMIDNPKPSLESVRNIVEQIAKGLQAFHRQEMVHQDLRPQNIMIDTSGTVKIIDFGSTKVAGVSEAQENLHDLEVLGTAQYTAPEYYIGEGGSARSDIYSLAVITYQMLSGKFPYGTKVAMTRSKNEQRRLNYHSIISDDLSVPLWVDAALKKATRIEPFKRYDEVSEFILDLKQPSTEFLAKNQAPLIERNPVLFWQVVSLLLLIIVIWQAASR